MPTPLLLSPSEVFVHEADLPEFQTFVAGLAADFAPSCEVELQCVRTIAHSLWTIRRTRILERRMQERAVAEGYIDPLLDIEWAKQLNGILRLRRQSERSHQLALKDLAAFRKANIAKADPVALPAVPQTATATAAAASANVVTMSSPRLPEPQEDTAVRIEHRQPARLPTDRRRALSNSA